MRLALRVARIRDIDVFVHWTFGVLVAGVFVFYVARGTSPADALFAVAIVLAMFLCVVLHELGHALTAASFHVPTRDITLYPIGGVARLMRMPEEPWKEFAIAIAGPAVNLVLAGLFAGYLAVNDLSMSTETMRHPRENLAGALLWMNLALAAFNLLPAFPMDGGRVLRALLAIRMPYHKATEVAAGVGQFLAILFGLAGVAQFNPVLIFIALFVYIGAQQESQQTTMRALTQGIPVRQAMMTRFRTLSPDDTLGWAVNELLAGSDQDFPVVQGGRLVGILTRRVLVKGLTDYGDDATIARVQQPVGVTVDDSEMLDEAFARLQEAGVSTIPVLHEGRLVGVLNLENVGELLMVSTALRKGKKRVA